MRNLSQVSSSGRSNLCAVSQRAEDACACSCCRRSHACLICAATTCKVASTHYPVHVCLNSQTIQVDNVFSCGKQKREKKCKRYQLNASTNKVSKRKIPKSRLDSRRRSMTNVLLKTAVERLSGNGTLSPGVQCGSHSLYTECV